jgi:hypothetical protein
MHVVKVCVYAHVLFRVVLWITTDPNLFIGPGP